jgi:lipoyl(octanoyl) transferase
VPVAEARTGPGGAGRQAGATRELEVEWLGRVAYGEALEIQARAVASRQRGVSRDRLLLLEHPAVVTLGRSTREENLLVGRAGLSERGIERFEVPRGGDVTYHAPGQLVGYLIIDLKQRAEPDLHGFLRRIEAGLMDALAELGLATRRIAGKTGVFMERGGSDAGPDKKIASIGVGVRRWVTFHGFALNVSVDLDGFDVIVPCGLEGVVMTSVASELGCGPLGLDARMRAVVADSFRREFERADATLQESA